MEIRSVEKAGLIRWSVALCGLLLFGCAALLVFGSCWLRTKRFIDRAAVRHAIVADHRSDQIGREGKQRPMTIHADLEPLASDVEKSAYHADADYRLVRSAQAGVRTDHGQNGGFVNEVLEERDVYFALGVAQDHFNGAAYVRGAVYGFRSTPLIAYRAGYPLERIVAHGSIPRNTPAAHRVLSNWAKHVNPTKEVA